MLAGLGLCPRAILASDASGVDAGRPASDGGDRASAQLDAEAPQVDPRVAHLRALLSGSLDVAVAPQALFDVPLSDEPSIQIEAVRVRALLRAMDDAVRVPAPRGRRLPVPPDAGTLRADIDALDPSQWSARVELDRARLDFLSLSRGRRDELLRDHAARKEAARPRETDEALRAREADTERQRTLEAARVARTEAERLVGEELARLIAVEAEVSKLKERFGAARAELTARRDVVLGWQRRVRDAKAGTAEEADTTYDALRRTLRSSRDDLGAAIDALDADASSVPELGVDALARVPADIEADVARARRLAVQRAIAEARKDERDLRGERAAALLEECTTLNQERLDLLSDLSPAKYGAITGFTAPGWDQARSEARHLALILRYHQRVATAWLASLRATPLSGASAWRFATLLGPWVLLASFLLWARRRVQGLLRLTRERLIESERAHPRSSLRLVRRVVYVVEKAHRSIGGIVFLAAARWLAPPSLQNLLEVQLVGSILGWILGGSLVVHTLDALASSTAVTPTPFGDGPDGTLRLRSLRLVGWTVVVLALMLVVSSRLVGQGTIYRWVISTCGFVAIPVLLLLVRWWRTTIFERIERSHRTSAVQAWVLSNRSGWKSPVAATLGAIDLVATGVAKTARRQVSSFDLARRVHAYLFKRELERLNEEAGPSALRPLRSAHLEALHPAREVQRWLPCPADEALARLARRIGDGRGGVYAVVGARGMGKSSLLRALRDRTPARVVELTCTAETGSADARALMEGAETAPALVLLDEAQSLLKPLIGGLATLDAIVSIARAHAATTTWVLAIDSSAWPFLSRARDARPIFDEVLTLAAWDEAQVGALLADRCALAEISPTFDDLLDNLPPGASDLDRADARAARQAGYERMLWDHVRGNPGMALEAWRSSLAEDADGGVHVRPLQVPDASRLDLLPDSSLFILRAVLQLAPAAVDDVARAARLSRSQVEDAVRSGESHGFFAVEGARVVVTWPWLRAVLRILERKHLLVKT